MIYTFIQLIISCLMINITKIKNMEKNRLVDQLKKHIEEVGEETFKQEVFEFNCEQYDIDPKAKNAKQKLEMKQFWEKIRNGFISDVKASFMLSILWSFLLGVYLAQNKLFWIFVSTMFSVYFIIKIWKSI